MKLRTTFFGAGAALLSTLAVGMPVQAQPVEYVRVCDAYGAGWFYIPGTDKCVNADTGRTKKVTENGVENGVTKQLEGVAVSLALPTATVTPGHTYGAAMNVGTFGGASAVGVGGAYQLNDNVTFNGAVGMGLQDHTAGGRAGVNLSW